MAVCAVAVQVYNGTSSWYFEVFRLMVQFWYVGLALLALGSLRRFAKNPRPVYRVAQVIGAAWIGLLIGAWATWLLTCGYCSEQ
jgi:hypothetical protein